MALTVSANPTSNRFTEFVRIDITASDDGTGSTVTGPFEILYTTDGSLPSATGSTTTIRRSPIKRLPLTGPTTLKFFARVAATPTTVTEIQVEYYDIVELTARHTIPIVPASVTNYTLKVENKDISRTDEGYYNLVWGKDKTAQDIEEIILVEDVEKGRIDAKRTLPYFGSALNRLVGGSFPVGFAANSLKISIYRALNNLTALQKASRAPSNEQIRRIISVDVIPQVEGDATAYRYYFVVQTVSGETSEGSGLIVGG